SYCLSNPSESCHLSAKPSSEEDYLQISNGKSPNGPSLHIGIGLDCSVSPIPNSDLFLIQTTDFFSPLIDDPYLQGKIACANVLSDLYAMGVTQCVTLLNLLAVKKELLPMPASMKDESPEASVKLRDSIV